MANGFEASGTIAPGQDRSCHVFCREGGVYKVQDARCRTPGGQEVDPLEGLACTCGATMVECKFPRENFWSGPLKGIDGLLLIAHHEHIAGQGV